MRPVKAEALIQAVETHPENIVYVSIDDVGVDYQKDTWKAGGRKQGKVVKRYWSFIDKIENILYNTSIKKKEGELWGH